MIYKLKVIKDEREYRQALAKQRELMESGSELGSDDLRRLEVLTVLIEKYEKERFEIGNPDPIEAIKIRMEDKGMKQRDLATLLSSPTVASEILSRKRNLSLSMMRLLSKHLDIPVKIFLNHIPEQVKKQKGMLSRALINELVKKGWIREDDIPAREVNDEWLREIFPQKRFYDFTFGTGNSAYFRRQLRRNATVNPLALKIWQYKALERGARKRSGDYDRSRLTVAKLRELARLSGEPDGVKNSGRTLAELGIRLVILPHLKKTHIDGAAMLMPESNTPLIALTLRYDRVDHFWFSLFHELGHIIKHLGEKRRLIFDDLEILDCETQEEREANEFARDMLIPNREWQKFYREGKGDYSPVSVEKFARKLGISPAIVAGRIRYETNNYRILSQTVGYNQVRKAFYEEYFR